MQIFAKEAAKKARPSHKAETGHTQRGGGEIDEVSAEVHVGQCLQPSPQ